jgi:uncharacterized protein (TIGR02118 family)
MMAKLVVLYPKPTDPDLFDKAYIAEHVPLFQQKMPHLKLAVSWVKGAAAGESPYHLMAEVWAPSIEALQTVLASPEGQQVVAHATSISTGGPPTVLFTQEDVHEAENPASPVACRGCVQRRRGAGTGADHPRAVRPGSGPVHRRTERESQAAVRGGREGYGGPGAEPSETGGCGVAGEPDGPRTHPAGR